MGTLEEFFDDYTMRMIDPLLHMQLRGVLVDTVKRDEIRSRCITEQQEAIETIARMTDGKKIMGKKTISPKALAELLYNEMGLPVQLHPKTRKPTTNEDALNRLSTKVPADKKPLFDAILTVRDLGVLISTFLDAKLDDDGRLRATYNIAGTETGRLSSSSSPFWTGTNQQNFPPVARDMVVADPGYVFVYGDGAQAEARVVGILSQDRGFMHVFESGLDVHSLMASKIFNIPYEQIKSDSEERDLAKRTVHAGNYGMGPRKFALIIKKPESFAKELLARHFAEFPGIKAGYQAGIRTEIDRTRVLTTPFGRQRQFFGRVGDELYREGYAYKPQSTIGDWMNVGLLRLWRFTHQKFELHRDSIFRQYLNLRHIDPRLSEIDIRPAIQIHDALVAQVRVDHLEQGIQLVKECLTYPIIFKEGSLTIPVDVKIGLRWRSLKKPTQEWIAYCKEQTTSGAYLNATGTA